MTFEFITDVLKMLLSIAALYFALHLYVKHKQISLTEAMQKRRSAITLFLLLLVVVIKVSEDVIGKESGAIDESILQRIHSHSPDAWMGFWQSVTFTGSSTFIIPMAVLIVVGLSIYKRYFDALLLALSVTLAGATVYAVKTMVNRSRPALWDTEWYWGSSFPSGHTLAVASFATALYSIIRRLQPSVQGFALWATLAWIGMVGLSRLVLGVHWPTDVLVASCIGTIIPLLLHVVLESLLRNQSRYFK